MNVRLTRRGQVVVLAIAFLGPQSVALSQVFEPPAPCRESFHDGPYRITQTLANGDLVANTEEVSDVAIDGLVVHPGRPLDRAELRYPARQFCPRFVGPRGFARGSAAPGLQQPGAFHPGRSRRGRPRRAPRRGRQRSAVQLSIRSRRQAARLVERRHGLCARQVLLQNFQAPLLLAREEENLYVPTAAAGGMDEPAAPGDAGLGHLLDGWLNVTIEPVRLSLRPSANQTGALTEGVLTPTSIPSDLGIRGPGFFIVRDPNTLNLFATRAGLFLQDPDGYLVTYGGLRVQGYSDPGLALPGDIQLDAVGAPATAAPWSAFESFAVYPDGIIMAALSDGTTFIRGQILLSEFVHPEFLTATNYGLYAGVAQAEPQRSQSLPSKWNPSGVANWIQQGALELINVSEDLLALRQRLSFFTPGAIVSDPSPTHLAIVGTGFFLLRDPRDDAEYVTLLGTFSLDRDHYLVNSNGMRVQGYTDSSLTTVGDIQIDAVGAPSTVSGPVSVSSFTFTTSGTLLVTLSDGTVFARGQVLLQRFAAPYLLKSDGGALYTGLWAAAPWAELLAPGKAGSVQSFRAPWKCQVGP